MCYTKCMKNKTLTAEQQAQILRMLYTFQALNEGLENDDRHINTKRVLAQSHGLCEGLTDGALSSLYEFIKKGSLSPQQINWSKVNTLHYGYLNWGQLEPWLMTQNQAERHAAFVNERITSLGAEAKETAKPNVDKLKALLNQKPYLKYRLPLPLLDALINRAKTSKQLKCIKQVIQALTEKTFDEFSLIPSGYHDIVKQSCLDKHWYMKPHQVTQEDLLYAQQQQLLTQLEKTLNNNPKASDIAKKRLQSFLGDSGITRGYLSLLKPTLLQQLVNKAKITRDFQSLDVLMNTILGHPIRGSTRGYKRTLKAAGLDEKKWLGASEVVSTATPIDQMFGLMKRIQEALGDGKVITVDDIIKQCLNNHLVIEEKIEAFKGELRKHKNTIDLALKVSESIVRRMVDKKTVSNIEYILGLCDPKALHQFLVGDITRDEVAYHNLQCNNECEKIEDLIKDYHNAHSELEKLTAVIKRHPGKVPLALLQSLHEDIQSITTGESDSPKKNKLFRRLGQTAELANVKKTDFFKSGYTAARARSGVAEQWYQNDINVDRKLLHEIAIDEEVAMTEKSIQNKNETLKSRWRAFKQALDRNKHRMPLSLMREIRRRMPHSRDCLRLEVITAKLNGRSEKQIHHSTIGYRESLLNAKVDESWWLNEDNLVPVTDPHLSKGTVVTWWIWRFMRRLGEILHSINPLQQLKIHNSRRDGGKKI